MTSFVLQPWHLLVTALAGMLSEEQQSVIEYLRTENQVLSVGSINEGLRLPYRLSIITIRVFTPVTFETSYPYDSAE